MIVENLYNGNASPRFAMQPKIIRMSLAGACTRREAYSFLGYKEDNPSENENPDRQSAAAQDGDLHEADIISRLEKKKYEIWNQGRGNQLTLHYTDKFNNKWLGHPDLFIKLENEPYGIDVKGFRTEIFASHTQNANEIKPGIFLCKVQDFDKRPYSVVPQMQLYLHSDEVTQMGITKWVVIMKDKNDSRLAEVTIERDDDYLDRLVTNWRNFWTLVGVGRLPTRGFEFGSIECEQCPFGDTCYKKELLELANSNIVDKSLVVDAEFIELAEKALVYQEAISESKYEFLAMRNRFVELLIELKRNSIYIPVKDGFAHIVVHESERESANPLGIEYLESLNKEKYIQITKFPVVNLRKTKRR